MGPVTGFVAFAIIWWVVLFAVLPFGVRGQWEGDGGPEGTEPGAPQNPQLGRKALATTVIAAALWLILASVIWSGVISIDDLPAPFDTPEL